METEQLNEAIAAALANGLRVEIVTNREYDCGETSTVVEVIVTFNGVEICRSSDTIHT